MSKRTVVFEAPFWSRSGYGDHARDLLKSLIDIGSYDIKIATTSWGDCPNDRYPEFDSYQLNSTSCAMHLLTWFDINQMEF